MNHIYHNTNYKTDIKEIDNHYQANINGDDKDFIIQNINQNIFRVADKSNSLLIYIADDDKNYYAFADGNTFVIEKPSDEEKSFGAAGQSLDKDFVKPPMPGSIVKVEVSVGQKVSEGDALIIVEAMKMETTLYSSINGVVTQVNVSAGEQVAADKILVVVEKEIDT